MNDSDNRPRRLSHASGSKPRSDPDDAAVARLLRLAGQRPAVPARDAEIVKWAARAEWLRAVRAERRRAFITRGAGGLLAAAALVALVLGTGLLRLGRPGSGPPVATVETATGRVTATQGGAGPDDLAAGATLRSGAVVETGPRQSGAVAARAAFRLADGTSIRLDAGSRVRLLSDTALALDRGALFADSGPASGRSLEIHTPLGVARDVGTQFIVRLDAAGSDLTVQVREGEVRLDPGDGHPQAVTAGWQLAVLADGTVARRELARSGGPWDWVLDVRPPFDADGRTLDEVLTWAARESGWQLRYADPAVAARAAATVVHGPTDGMTPEDVAATFLLGSGGLGYRLEAGTFVVEPAAP